MPSCILILLFLCISVIVPVKGGAQACALSKAPGWSDELRQLYADCSNTLSSPDGSILFQIGPVERIHIIRSGHALALIGNPRLALPAAISWSPSSQGLFLNDGNGSGLASQLRLFRVAGTTIKEDDAVNRAITRIYRDRNKCDRSTDDPNVYGVGWSSGGKMLYAIAQSTVNAPCGEPTKYLGFVVDVESEQIKQVLSTQQAKSQFDQFLPQELR